MFCNSPNDIARFLGHRATYEWILYVCRISSLLPDLMLTYAFLLSWFFHGARNRWQGFFWFLVELVFNLSRDSVWIGADRGNAYVLSGRGISDSFRFRNRLVRQSTLLAVCTVAWGEVGFRIRQLRFLWALEWSPPVQRWRRSRFTTAQSSVFVYVISNPYGTYVIMYV